MNDRLAILTAARLPAQQRAWSLQDELRFIERMGTWACVRYPLRSLLTGYLKALEKRHSGLTEMDCIAARQRAIDMLHKLDVGQ